jgi:hypothetical protein
MLILRVLFDMIQGDDFDIYFFLFFILPILVPVVGLGVVVPGMSMKTSLFICYCLSSLFSFPLFLVSLPPSPAVAED